MPKVGMQVSHPLSKNDNRVAQTLSAIWSRLLAASTQTFFGIAVFPPMLSQSSDVERFVNNPIVWPWFRDRYMMGGSLARNWSSNVKKYLCEECQIESRKRKPNDGPALQAFCSALGVPRPAGFTQDQRPDFAAKLTNRISRMKDSLVAHALMAAQPRQTQPIADTPMPDTSAELSACAVEVEGSTPAKRVCTEQTALEPIGAAPTHESTPVKRPEPGGQPAAAHAAVTPLRVATPVRPDTYLSPSAALRLSQSCRKSPLSEPSFAAHRDSLPMQTGAARRQLAAVIRDTEARLYGAAQKKVQQLYDHFKEKVHRKVKAIYRPQG